MIAWRGIGLDPLFSRSGIARMIPPGLSSGPLVSDSVRGRMTFTGSLLGELFQLSPPVACAHRWAILHQYLPWLRPRLEYTLRWEETITESWHSPAPAVGGEIRTRLVVDIEGVASGQKILVHFPTGLHSARDSAIVSWT